MSSEDSKTVFLHFQPNQSFRPSTLEARVLAAMAGEVSVNRAQMRFQRITGKLTEDVRFGFGILGTLKQCGTFDVLRRQVAPGMWEVAESHVHVEARALLFKSIGGKEDDLRSEFKLVSAMPPEQAARWLAEQR